MLLDTAGNIMQVLEGEKSLIQGLMLKITADSRHKGVIVLLQEAINLRQFAEWSMRYKKLSRSEADGFSDFFNKSTFNDKAQLSAGLGRF